MNLERRIQAKLMRRCLKILQHRITVPNSNVILGYEADLISITKAYYVHEYEIKTSIADYRRDFSKWLGHHRYGIGKHRFLQDETATSYKYYYKRPNYFWFVTCGFEIEPPPYAGYIVAEFTKRTKTGIRLVVKQEAPRLHTDKVVNEKTLIDAGRLIAFRVMKLYEDFGE
jgi:hypothetical protein